MLLAWYSLAQHAVPPTMDWLGAAKSRCRSGAARAADGVSKGRLRQGAARLERRAGHGGEGGVHEAWDVPAVRRRRGDVLLGYAATSPLL
jgi:uncharacterized membrane-anchored protein